MTETVSTPQLVYVVDDDPAIRISLSRALRLRGFEVGTFASGADFLARQGADDPGDVRPACLVLDHGMPGMTGLELQRHLNEAGNGIPIVFITGHGGVPESVQAMKGGAVDFLEKPFRQADLIARIDAALDLARARLDAAEAARGLRARFDRLTPREAEIVDHILARPAEVSSKDIGRHLEISPRTVDHHRARILEKLGVTSVIEMVDMARRAGR